MAGFHDGELAVQRRAGVATEAARLAGMVAPGSISPGASAFLGDRRFAVVSGRDSDGRLWASPLTGPPGFLDGNASTLLVHAEFAVDDPLSAMPLGQPVGLIAIEFAIRRRFRVNGTLTTRVTGEGMTIDVDQAFGNCPQYIHPRRLSSGTGEGSATTSATTATLSTDDVALISQADTFFLGTVHPERGADASHRGGPSGFVRVEGAQLWWPDYAGNNMFNSFGNLAVDPRAALLFLDFDTGQSLQLSGTATLEWDGPAFDGIDAPLDTGRRVRFIPERMVRSSHGVVAR